MQWNRIGLARPVICVFAAVLAWLVARSAEHSGAWYDALYSADALYMPEFFSDLLHHRDRLNGWRFSPAPNFFPDMAIYAAARLSGAGFRLAAVLCTFLQVALFLDAARSLVAAARLRAEAAMVCVLILSLTLCYWQYFHDPAAIPKNADISWLASLGVLGRHFGAILASLWGLALMCGILRSGPPGIAVRGFGLVALIIATGCSDMLYLIWFCAPAVLCLVCAMGFAKGLRLRMAALAVAVTAAGWVVYVLQVHYNPLLERYRDPDTGSWETAGRSFGYLKNFLFGAGLQNALHAALFGGAAALLAILALVRLILAHRRHEADPSDVIRAVIAGFLAAAPVVCVVEGGVTGMFHDLGIPRYTLPVVFMPLVGLGFAFAEVMDGREIRMPSWVRPAFLGGVVPLLCLFLVTRPYSKTLPPPAELSCLPGDRQLAGLADYWQARPVTLFGDGRIEAAPLMPDAVPSWWISNRYWLTHRRDQPDSMPLYSFIDMRRLDAATIERHYGKPSSIVTCGGGDIWFYDDAEQLTRRFMELYVHSAAALDP